MGFKSPWWCHDTCRNATCRDIRHIVNEELAIGAVRVGGRIRRDRNKELAADIDRNYGRPRLHPRRHGNERCSGERIRDIGIVQWREIVRQDDAVIQQFGGLRAAHEPRITARKDKQRIDRACKVRSQFLRIPLSSQSLIKRFPLYPLVSSRIAVSSI